MSKAAAGPGQPLSAGSASCKSLQGDCTCHHAVAALDVLDLRPDLLHDAHEFVAQDISLASVRAQASRNGQHCADCRSRNSQLLTFCMLGIEPA